MAPSESNVFWAGGGIVKFPISEGTKRILCKRFQVRNRLCFDDCGSSRKPARLRMRAVPTRYGKRSCPSLSVLRRTNAFNSSGRTGTDLGLWPSRQPCLLGPSLAISEWQINQLKMEGKSVEKSMGEVDSTDPNFLRYENRIATWARRTPVLRRKKRHGNL
jgi:hypothetical protein